MLSLAFLLCLSSLAPERLEACLPADVKLTDTVSAQVVSAGAKGQVLKRVTVKERLTALGARCRKGRLRDGRGREIRFYRLTGCWGNPPADYVAILARQRGELSRLRRRYTVIEIECNTSGLLPQ
jgi:hypothetical protein